MDVIACNYNSKAQWNNYNCEYAATYFDCSGNCVDTLDCVDVCGGTAFLDNCNQCVEGNTDKIPCAQDCNDDWGGTATMDN